MDLADEIFKLKKQVYFLLRRTGGFAGAGTVSVKNIATDDGTAVATVPLDTFNLLGKNGHYITASGKTITVKSLYSEIPIVEDVDPALADYIRLTAQEFHGRGVLVYSDEDGNTFQLFRDNIFTIKNTSGGTVNKGDVLSATGSTTGNVPDMNLALADSVANLKATMIATESISNGGFGRAIRLGLLTGINTNAFNVGDRLYVDASTPGAFTATAPTSPNIPQSIGVVMVKSVGAGAILVDVETPQTGGSGTGTTGGNDTEVQFNDGGAFAGDSTFTFNKTTKLLTIGGALNEAKGSDIASASTTDIGAATGNYVNVTGTTTITALGTVQAGTRRIVNFTGILTLTHNATSLILPTSANITTAAGDVAMFVSLGTGNWKCTGYMRADGNPVIAAALTDTYYSRNAVSISSGTLTLDIDSKRLKNFDLTSTVSSNFTIAFSNSTNLVTATLSLRVTGTVAITMPPAVIMNLYEKTNSRWNDSTDVLTIVGTTASPFLITFHSDGTNIWAFATERGV